MNHSRASIVVATVLGLALSACGQRAGSGGTADNSQERKEKILLNLKAKYPRLAELNPTFGEFKRVGPGLDQGSFTLSMPGRGSQTQQLLVTTDDKSAYIVMEGPIDVSRNATELKAEADKAQAEADKKNAERSKELAGLAGKYPTKGPDGAKVTIVEFSDFQCPYCKGAAGTVDQILKKYPNDVKLVYIDYPLPFHPWAKPAAIAAYCATSQDPASFWKLYDQFFANQKDITPENVIAKAQQFLAGTKVNAATWKKCATDATAPDNQAAQKHVEEMMAMGTKFGVEGTPAFFVNGEFLAGALPFEQFDQVVQKALK